MVIVTHWKERTLAAVRRYTRMDRWIDQRRKERAPQESREHGPKKKILKTWKCIEEGDNMGDIEG